MSITNRPVRTTAELIALINQRQADWWPADFGLSIGRSAEHDWIAVVDTEIDEINRGVDLTRSLSLIVADLRFRNAWAGH